MRQTARICRRFRLPDLLVGVITWWIMPGLIHPNLYPELSARLNLADHFSEQPSNNGLRSRPAFIVLYVSKGTESVHRARKEQSGRKHADPVDIR